MVKARIPAPQSETRKGKRETILKPVATQQSTLLATLDEKLEVACPDFPEMMKTIRRFVSSELSFERMTVVGVVSANPGEGRTTVAMGIASAMAEVYDRTLFVETESDEDKSVVKELVEGSHAGLHGYLNHEVELEDAILPCRQSGLWILPAGRTTDATALSSISNLRLMLSVLRPQYDVTVVDLPPLLSSEEAPALLSYLDAIVVVAAAGKTTSDDLSNVIAHCDNVPVKGVFLNKQKTAVPRWVKSIVGL
jgi:Mrp family chromosome partitioning ATPase